MSSFLSSTVTSMLFENPTIFEDAVICAVPVPFAVILPERSTFAIDSLSEANTRSSGAAAFSGANR